MKEIIYYKTGLIIINNSEYKVRWLNSTIQNNKYFNFEIFDYKEELKDEEIQFKIKLDNPDFYDEDLVITEYFISGILIQSSWCTNSKNLPEGEDFEINIINLNV